MIELVIGFPQSPCQIHLTSRSSDWLTQNHHMTVGGWVLEGRRGGGGDWRGRTGMLFG